MRYPGLVEKLQSNPALGNLVLRITTEEFDAFVEEVILWKVGEEKKLLEALEAEEPGKI